MSIAQTAARHWTTGEFFAWQERQEERYELVGGTPIRMMAGAKNRHDRIVVNLLAELRNRLRGSDCVPFSGDSAVETYPGQIRRPDAGIDCGQRDPDAYQAANPRVVIEVLSPSTRDFDTIEKLVEYKSVASLAAILVVEPNAADVVVWRRDGGEIWSRQRIEGLDAVVPLPFLQIELPLADIYEGVAFPAAPQRFVGG